MRLPGQRAQVVCGQGVVWGDVGRARAVGRAWLLEPLQVVWVTSRTQTHADVSIVCVDSYLSVLGRCSDGLAPFWHWSRLRLIDV